MPFSVHPHLRVKHNIHTCNTKSVNLLSDTRGIDIALAAQGIVLLIAEERLKTFVEIFHSDMRFEVKGAL